MRAKQVNRQDIHYSVGRWDYTHPHLPSAVQASTASTAAALQLVYMARLCVAVCDEAYDRVSHGYISGAAPHPNALVQVLLLFPSRVWPTTMVSLYLFQVRALFYVGVAMYLAQSTRRC
jgi:hypothetical protein